MPCLLSCPCSLQSSLDLWIDPLRERGEEPQNSGQVPTRLMRRDALACNANGNGERMRNRLKGVMQILARDSTSCPPLSGSALLSFQATCAEHCTEGEPCCQLLCLSFSQTGVQRLPRALFLQREWAPHLLRVPLTASTTASPASDSGRYCCRGIRIVCYTSNILSRSISLCFIPLICFSRFQMAAAKSLRDELFAHVQPVAETHVRPKKVSIIGCGE